MLDQMRVEKRFENDGEKNRLVLELDGSTQVIEFQVEMIRNNRMPGVLPLEMRRVDSRIMLYYDVAGKWMLKDLLDHKEFTGAEFLALLEKLIQAIISAEAYLLDITQFALDEEHIFLEGNMEPRLLYLPVRSEQNIHERFKNLLLQLIVYRARVKDQDSGPVLSGILNYMKRDSFNLYEFQKALRTLSGGGVHSGDKEKEKQELPPIRSVPVSLVDLIPKENRPSGEQKQNRDEGARLQPVKEHKPKTMLKSSVKLLIIAFQIVLAVGVAWGFGPVYQATEDLTTAYAAMGLMVVCLDGLFLKNMLKPENRITLQKAAKRQEKYRVQVWEEDKKPVSSQQPDRDFSAAPVNFNKKIISNGPSVRQMNVLNTEVLSPSEVSEGSNDTVVLSAQQAPPYLVRKGVVQEIIRLKRQVFVIGRQADMSDHVVDDPAIGRMHAELTWKGDICQIRDLNSKNGTFVNGMRLAGPQPVNIFSGDEIKLGTLEYTLAQD